ncbi:MAG: glutamine-hydrolyzing carbamoyl-phosphate synthase small subunit [Rhodospirillales bacterium]|nr:glutamine-hydrolyzing carbamoyl-phosphate synthase small subunit [Rhodospirillales bacterium]
MSDESKTAATIDGPSVILRPKGATACLALADGTHFWGHGIGASGRAVGELCFNTSMTGYQEILTDPSYAGQIITFTFPHVGNVGTNPEDLETTMPAARGLVLRSLPGAPSNWRSDSDLEAWLVRMNMIGLVGADTRALTRQIRDLGAPNAVICHAPDGKFPLQDLVAEAAAWPGLKGMDLARDVTTRQTYRWDEAAWSWPQGFGRQQAPRHHVVAVDYGAKRNMLRMLAEAGCAVTVVPATATAEEILSHEPTGIFLSNGPGDPAATGQYALPTLKRLVESGKPIFGICLGHQLLALALGAKTKKLHRGHRGANQPVKDLESGRVEITSQNHGFVVDADSLPEGVVETYRSLFDGCNEGLRVEGQPIFSVQHHPEASPGPQDSQHLFTRFVALMDDTG